MVWAQLLVMVEQIVILVKKLRGSRYHGTDLACPVGKVNARDMDLRTGNIPIA